MLTGCFSFRASFYYFGFHLLILVGIVGFPESSLAAEFFVSTSGSTSGNGTKSNPWDLQTALNQPASVRAGDTIWLREGTYKGGFRSLLTGTAQNPIIVREYPAIRQQIPPALQLHTTAL